MLVEIAQGAGGLGSGTRAEISDDFNQRRDDFSKMGLLWRVSRPETMQIQISRQLELVHPARDREEVH